MKNILKEGPSKNPKLDQGIERTVSILKKSYPFILDWEYNNGVEYESFVDIILICDLEKTAEFYDNPIDGYLKESGFIYNRKLPYPFYVLEMYGEMDTTEKYELYRPIKNDFEEIYDFVPEDYKQTGSYGIKDINIEGFLFKDKGEIVEQRPPLKDSERKIIELILETIILPEYEDIICGFDVKSPQDRLDINNKRRFEAYSVTTIFIGGKGNKTMYEGIMDDIWDTIYSQTDIAIDLYSEYVSSCKEGLNEQKQSNYLDIINGIVEPYRGLDYVCDVEVLYDSEDDFYVVTTWFDSSQFGNLPDNYTKNIRKEIKTEINNYLPIPNVYIGSGGTPNCKKSNQN